MIQNAKVNVLQAVERFLALDLKPGDTISHADLVNGVMQLPDPNEPGISHEIGQKRELALVGAKEKVFSVLLVKHRTALRSVHGFGYEIVKPEEQATWAVDEARERAARKLDQGHQRAKYVRVEALTIEQRRERADQLARVSRMRQGVAAVRNRGWWERPSGE